MGNNKKVRIKSIGIYIVFIGIVSFAIGFNNYIEKIYSNEEVKSYSVITNNILNCEESIFQMGLDEIVVISTIILVIIVTGIKYYSKEGEKKFIKGDKRC